MARPKDNSLKYYNRDTRDDDNLQYVEAVHGLIGYAIVDKLWKHIFGCPGGYYCEFGEINQRLFCKNNGITMDQLTAVLATCFLPDVKIFHHGLYEQHRILTSTGVQKRWHRIIVEAGRWSASINEEYWLIGTADKRLLKSGNLENPPAGTAAVYNSGEESTPAVCESGEESTQRKVKKSKEKERVVWADAGASATAPHGDLKKNENKNLKGRVLPKNLNEVVKYFTDRMGHRWDSGFISLQATKFFNHYMANGWVQGKGRPIQHWHYAVHNWIITELEGGVKGKIVTAAANPPPVSAPPVSLSPPNNAPPPRLSPEEKEATAHEFVNEYYQGYVAEKIPASEIPAGIYDYLAKRKVLNLSKEERDRLKSAANGDEYEAKRMAVVGYFNDLKAAGVKNVFEKVRA